MPPVVRTDAWTDEMDRRELKNSTECVLDRLARKFTAGRGAFQSTWLVRGVRKLGLGPYGCGSEETRSTTWPRASISGFSSISLCVCVSKTGPYVLLVTRGGYLWYREELRCTTFQKAGAWHKYIYAHIICTSKLHGNSPTHSWRPKAGQEIPIILTTPAATLFFPLWKGRGA